MFQSEPKRTERVIETQDMKMGRHIFQAAQRCHHIAARAKTDVPNHKCFGDRDRPGRTSRRLADWSTACKRRIAGSFRRDAENSGRDATRSQTKQNGRPNEWPPVQNENRNAYAFASVAAGFAFSAFCATLTSSANAGASCAAMSERILRSSSHLAALRPSMKRL